MKKTPSTLRCRLMRMLALSLGLALPQTGVGQGLIDFANPAPIFGIDGKTPLAGNGFLAELYAGPVGGSLEPIDTSITPFATGTEAGYFVDAIPVAVPGVPAGSEAKLQIVAWRASDGATFAQANHAGAHIGVSRVGQAILSTVIFDPPAIIPASVGSFSLYVVPEPSVLTLGLLGTVGLRWRPRILRRSKCDSDEMENMLFEDNRVPFRARA